jgi:protein SCO1/2
MFIQKLLSLGFVPGWNVQFVSAQEDTISRKRRSSIFMKLLVFLFACAFVSSAPKIYAHDHSSKKTKPQAAESVNIQLLDLNLVDQDGKVVKFKSDVIGDRMVAINFIYTTCTTVCPLLSQVFSQVQESLGDRLGKEVVLISVSVDPKTDIPRRLKDLAQKYHAKPGWFFLTGEKNNVDKILSGLGAYAADFRNHSTKVLVGNGHSGRWTNLYGVASPEDILVKMNELEKPSPSAQ